MFLSLSGGSWFATGSVAGRVAVPTFQRLPQACPGCPGAWLQGGFGTILAIMETGVILHRKNYRFLYGTSVWGIQSCGGWQESRTIRCGRTLAIGMAFLPSGWINMAAAVRPVSRVLRRTEVSDGHRREANGLSS